MDIRRTVMANPAFVRVPSLQSSPSGNGRSYIDLARKFDSSHKYVFEVNFQDTGARQMSFFGARGQNTYYPDNASFTYYADYRLIFYGGKTLTSDASTGYSLQNLQNTWTDWQRIELKAIDGLLKVTNTAGTFTATPGNAIQQTQFTSTQDVVLFNTARPDAKAAFIFWGSIRLYEEYDRNEALITRLLPYMRTRDRALGMLDTVTKQFLTGQNESVAPLAIGNS